MTDIELLSRYAEIGAQHRPVVPRDHVLRLMEMAGLSGEAAYRNLKLRPISMIQSYGQGLLELVEAARRRRSGHWSGAA